MRLKEEALITIKNWMYRNARAVDLARWQYHFEGGSQSKVIEALSVYQNADGGFGHALEADSWNPNSSPIQTWVAVEILREINIEPGHKMIKNILRYLDSGQDFDHNRWFNVVKSNDEYPGAQWWTFGDGQCNLTYNPTASLAGFCLLYSEKTSDLYKKAETITTEAIADFLSKDICSDMHVVCCYSQLLEYIEKAAVSDDFETDNLRNKLQQLVKDLIEKDTQKWSTEYVCKPSQFINSKQSIYFKENENICHYEWRHIQESRNQEGVWDITWYWEKYEEEFSISKNWWKGNLVIINMLYLKHFS